MEITSLPDKVKHLIILELNEINSKTYKYLNDLPFDKFSQEFAFWFKILQGYYDHVPELPEPDVLMSPNDTPFKVKPIQFRSAEIVEKIKSLGYINVAKLERKLDIPSGAIQKAMTGSRLIPNRHISKILLNLN